MPPKETGFVRGKPRSSGELLFVHTVRENVFGQDKQDF
jgi:hypothetical protein